MNKIANATEGTAIETIQINVGVNGVAYTRYVEPRLLLSDFLRQELGLTGTHVGCEHGVCGSCNVMVDGATARSCLVFASQLDNAKIETVESLGRVNALHPLQKAFWEKHGLQCGFCTPGMLMTAKELLDRNPKPTREDIREAISGNLCRCTGYQTIIEAIYSAAQEMQGVANG
jgi:carbon-monoxide dehydrogenase small subunit